MFIELTSVISKAVIKTLSLINNYETLSYINNYHENIDRLRKGIIRYISYHMRCIVPGKNISFPLHFQLPIHTTLIEYRD